MTNELKNEIKLAISAIIAAFAIAGAYFAFTFESKIANAFQNGYEQAILDAELVESSDTGYTLSFNGEVSWYTFD